MEHVFDSVCRCFGGVPATKSSARREARSSSSSSPRRGGRTKKKHLQSASSSSPDSARRRTSRLELNDKEWDGLFQRKSKQEHQQQQASQQQASKPLQYQHQQNLNQVPPNPDLEYARAVAEAKLAGASPTRRGAPKPSHVLSTANARNSSSSSSKRKSPATKRDEIFRTRRFDQINGGGGATRLACAPTPGQRHASPDQRQEPSNAVSRLLNQHPGVANALCFATPVRDEDDDDAVPLNEPDDDSTLNTCEDTITSTLYFDAKYAHLVEKRPPMPLFSHFKVTDEEDHIRRIVATDSHNSLNMIRLMNGENSSTSKDRVTLEDTSSEEDEQRHKVTASPVVIDRSNVLQHAIRRPRPTPASSKSSAVTSMQVDSSPPEAVKIHSSGSSKSTASTTPSSSSFPENGRVVHLS